MKLHYAFALGVLCLPMLTTQDSLTVKVNGVTLSEKAIVRNGVSYVPVKALMKELGGSTVLDQGAISVTIPVGVARGDHFWADENAFTAAEAAAFRLRAAAWASKARTLLELVDIDKLDLDNEALNEAVRGRLEWKRKEDLKLLDAVIEPGLYQNSWLALGFVSVFCDTMGNVIEALAEFRTLYLTHPRVEGFPSPELMASMTTHSWEGERIAADLQMHFLALVDWYNKYPSPQLPK